MLLIKSLDSMCMSQNTVNWIKLSWHHSFRSLSQWQRQFLFKIRSVCFNVHQLSIISGMITCYICNVSKYKSMITILRRRKPVHTKSFLHTCMNNAKTRFFPWCIHILWRGLNTMLMSYEGVSHFMLPFNSRMLFNQKTVTIVEFSYARLFIYSFVQDLICTVYIDIS